MSGSPALSVAPLPIDQSSSGVAYSAPLTPATIGNEPPIHRVSSDCFKKYICTEPVPFILRPTTINETMIVMMMMIIIIILIVINNYLFHVKNGVRTIFKKKKKHLKQTTTKTHKNPLMNRSQNKSESVKRIHAKW